MPVTFSKTTTINADGRSFNQKQTVTGGETAVASLTIPAAKAGAMTTKTSSSVGLITTTAAHGFTTGDKVSIFWQDPTTGAYMARHYCSLSAVTSTTLTTTTLTGFGDNLPVDGTALTVGLIVSRTIAIQGTTNGLSGIAAGAGVRAGAIVAQGATPVAGDVFFNLHQDNGFGFGWVTGETFPTPGLTADFASVHAASGDASRSATMDMVFLDS